MTLIAKRWYRSRRNQIIIFVAILICIVYYLHIDNVKWEPSLDLTRRESIIRFIEDRLKEEVRQYKGTGCEIPKLDPFAQEVMQFDKVEPKVKCKGQDWVKCHLSKCRVVPEILDTTRDIVCSYYDIVYQSDAKYVVGNPTEIAGDGVYTLTNSDHVKIKCSGIHQHTLIASKWIGHAVGFRTTVERVSPPPGREDTINVLIFGFDSTAKNGFIRKMPKSYEYLTNNMEAIVLNGYNIVGDGTPAALFPILTGRTELELPDVRRRTHSHDYMDSFPFIFQRLKQDGYRTAYFEDMPWIGTFQYRFNGFRRQPADHYLRAFYLEESGGGKKWWKKKDRYCVGDTPQYRLMMNITDQFLSLDGKRFCFTFVADITHDDFNMIATADDDMVRFLKKFDADGRREDTLLMVMGDHGPRFANVRDTLQGKLEERLPLMALVLPSALQRRRPVAHAALLANVDALTTPHDIHATLLDVLGFARDEYRVGGADLPRAMTLFEPIPRTRSCGEAGIEPHWCACLSWQRVEDSDPLHRRTADAFLQYINSLTSAAGSKCVSRTLTSTVWVMRQRANTRMLSFQGAEDADGYIGKFGEGIDLVNENYQIKVVVGPGHGIYEASLTYRVKEDKFVIDTRDISRTNAYGDEPSCISATHPHLNMFCYCTNYVAPTVV